MKEVRYKGHFLEDMTDMSLSTNNLEDHHFLFDVHLGEEKLSRAEIFIRVTSDERLEIIVNKVEHWEHDEEEYDLFPEMIGKIDVEIPPLTVKRQLGDDAVDWVEGNNSVNVNKRSK